KYLGKHVTQIGVELAKGRRPIPSSSSFSSVSSDGKEETNGSKEESKSPETTKSPETKKQEPKSAKSESGSSYSEKTETPRKDTKETKKQEIKKGTSQPENKSEFNCFCLQTDTESREPTLTPKQKKIIKETWAKVVPIREKAAELFYDHLFEVAPGVKPL